MYLSAATHATLLIASLVAIVVVGLTLRRHRTGLAILLWLIPIALAVSFTDLAMGWLSTVAPGWFVLEGFFGWLRVGFLGFVCLCVAEIGSQLALTRLSGGGASYRPATDPPPPSDG